MEQGRAHAVLCGARITVVNQEAPQRSAPGLRLSKMNAAFKGQASLFEALDLHIAAGSWSCLLGPSGVGKSTLLRLIAGLPSTATITGEVTADDKQSVADRIAYMGQQDHLLPWASILDNVTIGLKLRGKRPSKADREQARTLLAGLGLTNRHDALPADYSGGMRQRVALARTLFEDQPIILMDEPFSKLDALTRRRLQDLAVQVFDNKTVLLVTHDPVEALRVAERIIVMAGQPAHLSEPTLPDSTRPRLEADAGFWDAHGEILSQLGSHSVAA